MSLLPLTAPTTVEEPSTVVGAHPGAGLATTSRGRRVLRLARRLLDLVVVTVLAAAVVLAGLVVGLPWRLEPSAYVVLTGSMRPVYAPGTLVLTRPVAPAQVRVGDVLTYQVTSGSPDVVTHRVVARAHDARGWRYRLRGDANPTPDPGWVRPVQVRGRVWAGLPDVGRAASLLEGGAGQGLRWSLAGFLVAYAAHQLLRRERRADRSSGA